MIPLPLACKASALPNELQPRRCFFSSQAIVYCMTQPNALRHVYFRNEEDLFTVLNFFLSRFKQNASPVAQRHRALRKNIRPKSHRAPTVQPCGHVAQRQKTGERTKPLTVWSGSDHFRNFNNVEQDYDMSGVSCVTIVDTRWCRTEQIKHILAAIQAVTTKKKKRKRTQQRGSRKKKK